jgi:DNA adenine methylase
LGDVANYVEPFFGAGAVLLNRPTPARIETINDLDGGVTNFWRSVRIDPAAVARWADEPVHELDLHARHLWLVERLPSLRASMALDPDACDAKVAGWWLYGICHWIGSGWCPVNRAPKPQLPCLKSDGQGALSMRSRPKIREAMEALSLRMKRVRVASGDWSRIVTPSVTYNCNGMSNRCLTGVFLDPPYDEGNVKYAAGGGVMRAVQEWARSVGDNQFMRIVLAGYEGSYDLPGWRVVAWKAKGGFANGTKNAGKNAIRERLWLSPHCLAQDRMAT